MRFGVLRGLCTALGVLLAGGASIGNAFAAVPQLFPLEPHLVPVAVAAVFILPAIAACVISGLRRLRQAGGAALAIGVLAVTMAAVVMYADPQFLAALRG